MHTISNIKVGKPDTTPDKPSHTRGTREGNEVGSLEKEPGIYSVGQMAHGTARRSTSINAENRNPIHPDMPNLSPA